MSRLPELSKAQMEIMSVVWNQGETTVAQVLDELSKLRKLSRNTVQTMLSRLDNKGWLKHREDGNTFYYSAAVSRDKALRRMTRELVDTAFSGSAEGLVMALLNGRGLTEKESARIQTLIENSRKDGKQ